MWAIVLDFRRVATALISFETKFQVTYMLWIQNLLKGLDARDVCTAKLLF